MKRLVIKNPIVRRVLSAVALTMLSAVLLNLIFLLDYGFQSLFMWLINLFTPTSFETVASWFPFALHLAFVAFICLISWAIFRSRMKVFYKATFLTVPMATILMTFGILLYRWPVVSYVVSSLFTLGVLYYLYRTKKPWLYYFAVTLISLILLVMNITGTEI